MVRIHVPLPNEPRRHLLKTICSIPLMFGLYFSHCLQFIKQQLCRPCRSINHSVTTYCGELPRCLYISDITSSDIKSPANKVIHTERLNLSHYKSLVIFPDNILICPWVSSIKQTWPIRRGVKHLIIPI